ncbi:MAG: hypothetical protein ACLPX1_03640 [Steroidobacteraceae bacterium]
MNTSPRFETPPETSAMDACGPAILGSPRRTLHLRAAAQAGAHRVSAQAAGPATRISVKKTHKGSLSALTL